MRNLFVRQYDAFGDWVSINGLIRYIMDQRRYDKVYLVLEYNDGRKNFLQLLYGDEPKNPYRYGQTFGSNMHNQR